MTPTDRLKQQLGDRLDRCGFLLVSEIRRNLNRAQPYTRYGSGKQYYRGLDPSKPGEYPRKLSGQLLKSIAHSVDRSNLVLTVGTGIKYGKFLELGTKKMAARPWLFRTYHVIKQRIINVLRGA